MPKDPLCPLGFHPQVRWPTRCKRCFREYKEHAPRKDEIERGMRRSASEDTSSTSTEDKDFSTPYSSLSRAARERLEKHRTGVAAIDEKKPSSSYLSPPELGSPLRRNTTDLSQCVDPEQNLYSNSVSETFTLKLRKANSFNAEPEREDGSSSPTPPPRSKTPTPVPTFEISADNEQKGKKSPKSSSPSSSLLLPGESSAAGDNDKLGKKTKKKRLLIQGVQEVPQSRDDSSSPSSLDESMDDGAESSADVAFIIQVKSSRNKKKKQDDDDETMSMTTTTETTETTLVDVMANNAANAAGEGVSLWEFEEAKKEVDRLKEKCDKLEKEKADILTRRVSNLEAPRAQSAEYIKLQQKVNQLTSANEDLKDEQKHFETRVREMEKELASRPTNDFMQRTVAELRSKLVSAEAEIDKLNEDKREALQQMRDMQYEFEEMQDSFREEQSEEFATIKKELDEATKNCRLLQFKLRKVEKRCDQVEAEKKELEIRIESDKNSGKIAQLEQELAKYKIENEKLRGGLAPGTTTNKLELSPKLTAKKKSPVLTKAPSGETVDPPVTSEVDPAQLLCDLQSSLERESDLREQLKFAEEEVNAMMQKICRIEEENESLLIQVKKMSTPKLAEGGKGKGAAAAAGKVNGSSTAAGDSATDLKLQLEINEQESTILRRKIEDLEKTNTKLKKELHMFQDKIESLEKAAKLNIVKSPNVDEVSVLRRKLIEKEREIDRIQGELATAKTKTKGIRDKSVERRVTTTPAPSAINNQELEAAKVELKRVQEEVAKMKEECARQINLAGEQMSKAKESTEALEKRNYQLSESNKTLLGHMEKFKKDITTMKEHYEAIQDDFVLKNSNLLSEKEKLEKSRLVLAKEYDTIEKELKALRETFNTRQDTWIKEKLAMEEKMKEVEKASQKRNIPNDTGNGTGSQDASRLRHLLREQSTELDSQKRELSTYKDQIMSMQKENDELRRQLEDFEKLSQHKMRNLSSNESGQKSEKEIKAIRERLHLEEKQHKNEVAQMKLRHEQEVALKAEEISAVHSQLNRAKRERDTFRQMVDSAQRAIAELKSRGDRETNLRRDSLSSGLEEAATGARAAVITLQERVAALEDDLSESKRETARAKTELATENSAWEMKFGELQQKINELEEDKLLASGRVRAAGQKTRLELAWQKEREEQQRRLKEATTLARDLKTTMQEIEREREREKVEAKRRLEQTKLALEEDQEEMKRKIGESQCDLLELRDAHAKLRTANEKLRRDREKLEKDKEIQLKKELEIRRVYLERDKILDKLLHHLAPLAASPQQQLGGKVNLGEVLTYLNNIKQLKEPEDLASVNAKDKRKSNFRRTASAGEGGGEEDLPPPRDLTISSSAYGKEHYGTAGNVTRVTKKYAGSSSGSNVTLPTSRGRTPSEAGSTSSATLQRTSKLRASDKSNDKSLYRKSLSLEQTVSMPDEQKIWKGDSDAGSASSLKSVDSRGSSVDRFSTMSSKSEKPKSSSLVGKMKKFVKSKSIEDSPTAERVLQAGVQAAGIASNSSSISSLTSETEGGTKGKESSGKKLKDKVKGIFRRSSRSPSVERTRSAAGVVLPPPAFIAPGSQQQAPVPPSRPSRENTPKRDSTQRPLMPTESTQRPLMPSRR